MNKNNTLLRLTITALMAGLCYVGFSYLKISIPTPAGSTAFHLGNVFCVLAALLLGGVTGGIAGSIGMGIGDVLDPRYILVAPKTIILKFAIGFITGSLAHKVFKIRELEGKKLRLATVVSCAGGMFFNICAEPLFGYFYYQFIMNMPEKAAKTLAGFNLITTTTNAVLAVVIASAHSLAVASRFKKNGTLNRLLD